MGLLRDDKRPKNVELIVNGKKLEKIKKLKLVVDTIGNKKTIFCEIIEQ